MGRREGGREESELDHWRGKGTTEGEREGGREGGRDVPVCVRRCRMVICRRRGVVSMVAPAVPFTMTRRAWEGGREGGRGKVEDEEK